MGQGVCKYSCLMPERIKDRMEAKCVNVNVSQSLIIFAYRFAHFVPFLPQKVSIDDNHLSWWFERQTRNTYLQSPSLSQTSIDNHKFISVNGIIKIIDKIRIHSI